MIPVDQSIAVVVEDEPLLREITARRLRQRGFQVLEAEGAAEVAALFREYRGVNLLVVDVVLPGMSGPELVRGLEQEGLLEGVAVVFVSGYSRDELAPMEGPLAELGLLEKPFSAEALLAKIDEAMHAARAPRI